MLNELIACFRYKSIAPSTVAKLLLPEVSGFKPSRVKVSATPGGRWAGKPSEKMCHKISKSQRVSRLEVNPHLSFQDHHLDFISLGGWSMDVIYCYYNDLELARRFSKWCLGLPSLNAILLSSREDAAWQSEQQIDQYESAGRDHSHLPKTTGPIGDPEIDISGNPGRRTAFPGMWLQAAHRMTFAGDAFRFIPRERLLSFPHAVSLEEHDGGAITILLYENPDDAGLPESRERQKRFREWVNMDFLEANAAEMLDATYEADLGDAACELEETGDQGRRIIRQWYTESGSLIERSEASYGIEVLLDSSGQEISRRRVLPS